MQFLEIRSQFYFMTYESHAKFQFPFPQVRFCWYRAMPTRLCPEAIPHSNSRDPDCRGDLGTPRASPMGSMSLHRTRPPTPGLGNDLSLLLGTYTMEDIYSAVWGHSSFLRALSLPRVKTTTFARTRAVDGVSITVVITGHA